MKYAFVFSALGLVCAFYCLSVDVFWLRLVFASLALCWSGVGAAYAGVGGRIFGKRRDGRLALWSAAFWPFHLLNYVLLSSFRRGKKENRFDLVAENIWLGCQLGAGDEAELSSHHVRAVLDLTCEFAEVPFLRRLNYRSIAILDTRAPTLEQLQEGADFLLQSAAYGPVYVHCALGHGRSALFVAAYLVRSGQAKTAGEAVEMVRAKRPRIGLYPGQYAVLERLVQVNSGVS
ncbi:putative protein YnbD [Abditibacteriota bacterium]|nr:putative protein YnbD [Abditibacteriota bacterium]